MILASVALFGWTASVVGQEGGPLSIQTGPEAPEANPGPPPTANPDAAEAAMDLLTFFFVLACLAGGVIAIIAAARVYDRIRVDNPIIAAVNDPWVQNKIAQELAAQNEVGEVELHVADGRIPGHR
jgi:hypothetical protein